jgi:hypothetical protein
LDDPWPPWFWPVRRCDRWRSDDDALIGHRIGVPLFDQPVDHRDLIGDVARGGRFFVRAQAVEVVAILAELLNQLPRDFPERPPLLAGPADGLVVDVCEIPSIIAIYPIGGTLTCCAPSYSINVTLDGCCDLADGQQVALGRMGVRSDGFQVALRSVH